MAQALKFTTTCDDTQFEQAMRRIQRAALQASDRVSAGFVSAGAKLAGIAAGAVTIYEGIRVGRFLADGIKQAYDFGAEIDRISKRTGLFAEQVAILQKASRTAGIENLAQSVNKMQRSLEEATTDATGPAAKAFRDLRLNAASLIHQLPADQLQAVGQAINGIADPTRKAADAIAVFGRAGAELIPFFQNTGAIGNAMTALGRQARILGDNAATFRRVSELLQDAGIKIQGFFVGAAAEISGKLLPFLERLDRVDLAGIGRQFGDGLLKGVNFLVGAFQNPGAIFGVAIDYFTAGLLEAGNLLSAGLKAAIQVITNPSAWSGIAGIFEGLGQILEGALTKAFDPVIARFQAGIEFAIQSLPSALTGVQYRDEEDEKRLQSKVTAARYEFFHPETINPFERAANALQGVTPEENWRARLADLQQYQATHIQKADSIDDLTKQHLQSGTKIQVGDQELSPSELIEKGNQTLRGSVTGFFDSIAQGLKTAVPNGVPDVMGAGAYLARANQGVNAIANAGKQTVDNNTSPIGARLMRPGYGPNGKPVSQDYANQLRALYGPQKANQMLYGEGQAQAIDNETRAPLTAARQAQNIQLFGSYAASQMLTDNGQLKPQLDPLTGAMGNPSITATAGVGIGTGGLPSTGASIGSSGYLTPYEKMGERSLAPFANGTSLQTGGLTSGGLGGGAYGATGNIWTQLSGRVAKTDDPQKEAVNQLTKIASTNDSLLKIWQGGSAGNGSTGGATAGGK